MVTVELDLEDGIVTVTSFLPDGFYCKNLGANGTNLFLTASGIQTQGNSGLVESGLLVKFGVQSSGV